MRALAAFLALAAILGSGCAGPAPPSSGASHEDPPAPVLPQADPMADGPHGVTALAYDLGSTTVGGPDASHSAYEYEARLRGALWVPDGDGPFPLVAFLHGQHLTCGAMGQEVIVPTDCSEEGPATAPYPSHLGYAYLGEHLASHGFVVASILGYEVNERNGAEDVGMWARGELVLATLDAVRDAAAAGTLAELAGRLDTGRAGIMGHSRGGEGVVLATVVNQARPEETRWPLQAVVALAPTDFNGHAVADVPLLAVLPYCDGDVSNLHGLRTYDLSAAARHNVSTTQAQALVMGANHNAFNSRWDDTVAGPVRKLDDAFLGLHANGECDLPRSSGGGRLTPEEQRAAGLLEIAGFLRWTVGGDASLGPFFTGAAPLPPAACPAGQAPCPSAVLRSVHLPGRQALWQAGAKDAPAPRLEGFASSRTCSFTDCDRSMMSLATALELTWTGPATATWDVWGAAGMDVLTFRIAVGTQAEAAGPAPVGLTLLLDLGNRTVTVPLDDPALAPPPRTWAETDVGDAGWSKLALSMVRLPVAEAGVDPAALRSVALSFAPHAQGKVYLTDLLLQDERGAWSSPVAPPAGGASGAA